MRISTPTVYDQGIASMNRQQGEFTAVGQQLATGRRVVSPSDDPKAAAQAVGVAQSQALTQQFTDARVTARNSLSQEESVLNSVNDAITRAKTLLVQASSSTLSDADRQSVASELSGVYNTIVGQANATDGNGTYLFGGFRDDAPPYPQDGEGNVRYVGDTQVRESRIDASRLMPVSDHGEAIFQTVPSGLGYVAEASRGPGSDGDLTFQGPTRLDATRPGYGEDNYRIEFLDDAQLQVVTMGADGTTRTGETQRYRSGEPVELGDGALAITLRGTPEAGDSVTLRPADHPDANQDLFASLKAAIEVLEVPVDGDPATLADLRNTLSTSMRELDNSLDNVLTVRASVGARLNELDVVDGVGENRMLNYEQNRSDLVDLNYVDAIADYSLREVGLQAAQKSFADIQGMSLFEQL
ncbi:flagellar hook-associated protein FlgL [Halomonas sp. YLGW01]|uniref:flagellar hook-associated protein FlgL n=1 Tax=Halomonas sp. YLGW01 TaxID=2773308 RepID=UPI001783C23A|nr:flagellar hook-associated protein FlgL [Halomonas sp. YLGW01]